MILNSLPPAGNKITTMMLALLTGFHPFIYNLLTSSVLRFMSDVHKADERAEDEGRGFCDTLFIPFCPSTYMALLIRGPPEVATELYLRTC